MLVNFPYVAKQGTDFFSILFSEYIAETGLESLSLAG
jgi:hypothetical protein